MPLLILYVYLNCFKAFIFNYSPSLCLSLSLYLSLVTLGSPPPTVTWLMNGQLQNSVVDYTYDGTINSKLVVRNLSRIHQHAVYTCQASNFHKKYVATNITIELYREYT